MPSPNAPSVLKTQLEAYFLKADRSDRTAIAKSIEQSQRFDEVAAELTKMDFWEPIRPDESDAVTWTMELPSGRRVLVQLPKPPESGPRPAIIHFSNQPAQGSASAQTGMGLEAIWITISPPAVATFHLPTKTPADLPAVMREIRRRVHLEVDRIYLFGEKEAADSAWIAAMMYPNEFAGLIVVEGIPRVPYPEQLLALILPNLRDVPFLSIGIDDPPGQPSPASAVNKAIAQFALAAGMTFETATFAPTADKSVAIPTRLVASAMAQPKPKNKEVSRWFRYLAQGNAGWLRATDLAGNVWIDEQLSIAVTSKEDRDEFIAETLKEKLFFLGGKIDGQTITIETKRIGAVEVRLSPEQVDFGKPVTININGRPRFEGMLQPSIKDLLETAYEDWDFQHPVYARKSFSIHAK